METKLGIKPRVIWEATIIRKDGTREPQGVIADSSWKWYQTVYDRISRFIKRIGRKIKNGKRSHK